jgi:hypothetical protein
MAAYIGHVGLRPEDVYGIYAPIRGRIQQSLTVIYRDRPEYAAGRERYWQAVASR